VSSCQASLGIARPKHNSRLNSRPRDGCGVRGPTQITQSGLCQHRRCPAKCQTATHRAPVLGKTVWLDYLEDSRGIGGAITPSLVEHAGWGDDSQTGCASPQPPQL